MGVCPLTQLVCLRSGEFVEAPDGLLSKMKSLEQLRISIDGLNDESKLQFMKELGNLSEAMWCMVQAPSLFLGLWAAAGKLHHLVSV